MREQCGLFKGNIADARNGWNGNTGALLEDLVIGTQSERYQGRTGCDDIKIKAAGDIIGDAGRTCLGD